MKKHFGSPLEDFFPVKKKWPVAGDFFMDDTPENVILWKKFQPGKAFLFTTARNRGASDMARYGIQRVNSWPELSLHIV